MNLNKNKMGGALLCIVAVIALLILMDICIGRASAWLYHRSKYGIFHRQQYVLNESTDDILILGSSRASHHYVPSILTDSLGLSCYNAGSEGMCIYYHYAMLASMIERGHCPKLVIYDVMDFDVKEHPGPTFTLDAALDRLAPHYGEYSCIDELFEYKGWKEKLKLLSQTYRYNSKLVQSIKCNFLPQPEDHGYEKVVGFLPENVVFQNEADNDYLIDSLKLKFLQELINLAKHNSINILFVMSPCYQANPSKAYDVVKEIAEHNQIAFVNCSNEPELMSREWFRDTMHLNDEGAHVWTTFLVRMIKANMYNTNAFD